MVDLIISASRVDEVQSSASEAGCGKIVGAVGLVATEVAVAVVVNTYKGAAAREFVSAQAAVAVAVQALHSSAVLASFLLFREADFAVAVEVAVSAESSQHLSRLGQLFLVQASVSVEIEGQNAVLSAVVAAVVVQVQAVSADRSAAEESGTVADDGAVEVALIRIDRSVNGGSRSPAATPAAACVILISKVDIDIHRLPLSSGFVVFVVLLSRGIWGNPGHFC